MINPHPPKILLIDPDDAHAHLLSVALGSVAHVTVIPSARGINAAMANGPFDQIWVDPTPTRDIRAAIAQARRQNPTITYVVAMTHDEGLDVLTTGANDVAIKPVAAEIARAMADHGQQLLALVRHLNNPDEDFPSSRGIIAKSAFAQLFMAALERADRYMERAHVLMLRLLNANQIRVSSNDYVAHTASATLGYEIARLRRQSDILAQIGPHDYALLLQRPMFDSEPIEAALRFADALSSSTALATIQTPTISLGVQLMDLPSGTILSDHDLDVRR